VPVRATQRQACDGSRLTAYELLIRPRHGDRAGTGEQRRAPHGPISFQATLSPGAQASDDAVGVRSTHTPVSFRRGLTQGGFLDLRFTSFVRVALTHGWHQDLSLRALTKPRRRQDAETTNARSRKPTIVATCESWSSTIPRCIQSASYTWCMAAIIWAASTGSMLMTRPASIHRRTRAAW
jgi:hypothetical protein